MAKRTASELFDKKGFISDVEEAMENILSRPEDFGGDAYGFDEGYSYYMFDLSSGSAGNYQASEILDLFEVSPEEVLTDEELAAYEKDQEIEPSEALRNAEFAWDYIDYDLIPPVEDELNSWLQESGLPGSVSFGHLEADGSYGLFYHMDETELEDYLDQQEQGEDERGMTAADRREHERFMKDQPGLPYDEEDM